MKRTDDVMGGARFLAMTDLRDIEACYPRRRGGDPVVASPRELNARAGVPGIARKPGESDEEFRRRLRAT